MATRSLGLLATLALTANAFLLPPDLSTTDIRGDSDPAWNLIDPSNEVLLVPCDGCKTSSSDENNLFMNISVGSQPGTLELGGKIFYPPRHFIDDQSAESPYVLEVPTDVTLSDIRRDFTSYSDNGASVTGWGFASSSSETTESGDEILSMTLTISMINMQRVNVPAVDLQVMKRTDGGMFIVMSRVNELKKGAAKGECDGPLCEWSKLLEDKLHGIAAAMPKMPKIGKPFGKPCKGHKGGLKGVGITRPPTNMHHGPHSHHDGANRRPVGEHGHHGRPHHHHAPHHRLHRFLHHFGKFVMAIAIPILIGIAAGVATYAVGMLIGCVIALIWVKFIRGGQRGYASVALDEEDASNKEVVAAKELEPEPRESYESAPPVYEEAPVYEEKETVQQE